MSSRPSIRDRYSFANLEEALPLPDLIAIQRESFDWFLDQVRQAPSPQRLIRRFSRTGYEGDEAIGDIDRLRAMVRTVQTKADALFMP